MGWHRLWICFRQGYQNNLRRNSSILNSPRGTRKSLYGSECITRLRRFIYSWRWGFQYCTAWCLTVNWWRCTSSEPYCSHLLSWPFKSVQSYWPPRVLCKASGWSFHKGVLHTTIKLYSQGGEVWIWKGWPHFGKATWTFPKAFWWDSKMGEGD